MPQKTTIYMGNGQYCTHYRHPIRFWRLPRYALETWRRVRAGASAGIIEAALVSVKIALWRVFSYERTSIAFSYDMPGGLNTMYKVLESDEWDVDSFTGMPVHESHKSSVDINS